MSEEIATIEYMARRCLEFDTVMAAAFRRALGIAGAAPRRPRPAAAPVLSGSGVYGCMEECFANARRVRM